MDPSRVLGEDESFAWDWIRVVEVIESDGSQRLHVEHSDDMAPWKLLGMLQAAADWHRTLTTNVMFGGEYALEMFEDEDDD
jgi:hypothetical protein